MDFLGKARKFESTISRKLDNAARELMGSGAHEPIEIVNLIVDAVEREIQSSGRGRRVFPFNRIEVSVLAPSRDQRARLEAVVDGEPALRERIVERLRAARCQADDVAVGIAYVTRPHKIWRHPGFHLDFHRLPQTAVAETDAVQASETSAAIELTVLLGTAEQRTYSFDADRIDLGRSIEVRDSRHRLIRMNHVAFVERGGDVNQTVSRQHAHIAYEPRSGHYRLHDDGSAHGTGIVRNGRTIAVPSGTLGVRIRSGDEIVLGEARLKVAIPALRQP
jgi:hypothetical protein